MAETALKKSGPPPRAGPEADRAKQGGDAKAHVRSGSPSPVKHASWRGSLVLTSLALLLPRVVLPGGANSAGLSLVLALTLVGADHVLWYALAAILGLMTARTPLAVLALAPAHILTGYLGRLLWPSRTRSARIIIQVLVLATLGPVLVGRLTGGGWPWLSSMVGSAWAVILALVIRRGLPILQRGPSTAGSDEGRLFLAGLPLALAVLGLPRVNFHGLNLAVTGAVFIVAFLGHLGGPGLGAGAGLLLAMVLGKIWGPWPSAVGLAVGGLLAGVFRRAGRLGIAAGFTAGFFGILALRGLEQLPSWSLAGQALLGLGAFCVLPERSLAQAADAVPADCARVATARDEQAHLHELLSDRIQDLAGIFARMSQAFTVAEQERGTDLDLYSLLDRVVQGNCQDCAGFDACWRQNFYSSYRELFDLIALAEMHGLSHAEHMRGRLATACIRQRKLLETIGDLLAHIQLEHQERQRTSENRNFVADQLEGVANIMSSLAAEIHLDMEFRGEVEDRLKAAFNRLGLSISSLCVLDYGPDLVEVRLKKHGCLNQCECQYLIAPMVSRLLGHSFKVWEKECPQGQREECSFILVPLGRFELRHAADKIAKDDQACGDNHAIVRTKDGRCALLLSDGMGTGEKAARESKATIELLAQLLSAGLDEEFALRLINSVLTLRTPDERFATIDIALVDLFRGQVEFIKVGAAPSYLKRGRSITTIRAVTPPAGILRQIEVDRQRRGLSSGDYLILVSDGVFAGALGPEATEDWVERALARVEVGSPESLVDFLLKIARVNMGSEIKDDATVVVAQVLTAGVE